MSFSLLTGLVAATLLVLAFCGTAAQAGTIWDGGGADTNINTAANWDADALPTSLTDGTQTLTFGTGGSTATINTNVNALGLVINRDAAFAIANGAGNLTIGTGGITVTLPNTTARTHTISESNLILAGDQTWSVTNNTNTAALTVSSAISGSFGITKAGNGTLTLNGANSTFTGGILVNAGRLDAVNTALGTGNVTIASNAFIGLTSAGTYTNNITINGGVGNGAIQSFTNSTLGGRITLASDATIGSRSANNTLTLSGGIDTVAGANRTLTLNILGAGGASNNATTTISSNAVNLGTGGTLDIGTGITVGTGTMNLNVGGNTWGTTIARTAASAGASANLTLNLGAANALGSSSSVLQLGNLNTALEAITVNLNGNSQTIGGLRSFGSTGSASANGTRTITSATAATLTIDNSSATNYLYDGVISGSVSLTKSGSATQTLSGNNTYTGNTAINAGILTITSNSSLPGFTTNGRYSVANGATLGVYNAVTDADIASMLGTTNFAAVALVIVRVPLALADP
ncbi:MAG: beta strand repeat-containing protein, partial [Spartobacteria bacterium]